MNSFDKFLSSIAIEGSVADNVALESDLMDAALESIFSRHREKKATKELLRPEFNEVTKVVRYLANPSHIANGYTLAKGPEAENRMRVLLNQYLNNPGKGKLRTLSEMKKIGGYPIVISYNENHEVKLISYPLEKDGKITEDVMTLSMYYKLRERIGDLPQVASDETEE